MIKIIRTTTIEDPISDRKICFENVYHSHVVFENCWSTDSIEDLRILSIASELRTLNASTCIKIQNLIEKERMRHGHD